MILQFFFPTFAHFITKKEANKFLNPKVRVRRFWEDISPSNWIDPAIEWNSEAAENSAEWSRETSREYAESHREGAENMSETFKARNVHCGTLYGEYDSVNNKCLTHIYKRIYTTNRLIRFDSHKCVDIKPGCAGNMYTEYAYTESTPLRQGVNAIDVDAYGVPYSTYTCSC